MGHLRAQNMNIPSHMDETNSIYLTCSVTNLSSVVVYYFYNNLNSNNVIILN